MITRLAIGLLVMSAASLQAQAEDSVRAVEMNRRQALLAADTVALSRMLAPDFSEISRFGAVRTRADNIRDIASGDLHLTSINYDSLTVRIYGDVAVLSSITYNSGTHNGYYFCGEYHYTR